LTEAEKLELKEEVQEKKNKKLTLKKKRVFTLRPSLIVLKPYFSDLNYIECSRKMIEFDTIFISTIIFNIIGAFYSASCQNMLSTLDFTM